MQIIKNILIVLVLIFMSQRDSFAQSAGINYQALVLNSQVIQIPGSDVQENEVPLSLQDVSFRFSITDEAFQDLYIEEQQITTDENGMVSLIVGDGTPLFSAFDALVWDGTVKYLNIEIDIQSQNQGYIFLDIQKILYLPQSGTGATIDIVAAMLNAPINNNDLGDLIWVTDVDGSGLSSLMVWDGNQWNLAQMDFDPSNELALVVVSADNDRDAQFTTPVIGDQVWSQSCECIQVYDGTSWIDFKAFNAIAAGNGLYVDANNIIKLGGLLDEPTTIVSDATNTLSLTGLQEAVPTNDDDMLMVDTNSGVITRTPLSNLFQEEVTLTIAATDGQILFATPLPIETSNKVNVYRNGIRIGFSVSGPNTVELEPEAICYAGDEVRIVQFSN